MKTAADDLFHDHTPAPAVLLDDIDPKQLVSANRKLHYQRAGTVRSYWRQLALAAAVKAYGVADDGCTWHQRARIILVVRWPDRRRHDVGNLYSYVAKPIVDGLVDARILPDDDDLHLIGPDMRRDLLKGPLRIAIHVLDLGDDIPSPLSAVSAADRRPPAAADTAPAPTAGQEVLFP